MKKKKVIRKSKSRMREFLRKKGLLLIVCIILIIIGLAYGLSKGPFTAMFLGSTQKSLRPEYCGTFDGERRCIDPSVFQYLPEYPADFQAIYELVYAGKIRDLLKVEDKYWKQPEIIPTWKVSGINIYLNPEKGRFGAFGFGVYPGEATVPIKPGQAVKLTSWLHTSWAIQTLQGMSLRIIYPSHADSETGISVEQEPSVARYFDANVSPTVVLLGPTWPYFETGPKFGHDGWIVPLTVDIKVKSDTPPGTYAVGVMPGPPPGDKQDEWTLKYKLRYTPAQYYQIGGPFFTVFFQVE